MLRYGKDVQSIQHWEKAASSYASAIGNLYHRKRLAVVENLLPSINGKTVVDFGCGEGVMLATATRLGAKEIIGIDPAQDLLSIAQHRGTPAKLFLGGVERLAEIARSDCLICANVLAYLTDAEERAFYAEARRLGGSIVVTHSNSLFDLFTLNSYTVQFFKDNFRVDVSSLLTRPTEPVRTTYNVRENPLAYPEKLKRLGFTVEQLAFINPHSSPPLLGLEQEPVEAEQWKLYFQCSMFAVRARAA